MSTDRSVLLHELREREFPITAEYTYLNAATQGPLPNITMRALEQAIGRAQFPGLDPAHRQSSLAELARTRLAGLLHADPHDLVFTSNTTHGLNICANGIEWHPGDNVVLPDREFPALMYTWLRLQSIGVEVRCVPWDGAGPSVDQLMAAVDSHTRVVSCSAVAWDSGYRMDLETLGRRCAEAGCLLIIDGIQAVGSLELDVRALPHISALSMHGYKWLLADFGLGALYVSPNAVEQIRPMFVGDQSVVDQNQMPHNPFEWQPGATRYSAGGTNTFGLTALATSLELIDEIGMPAIEAHNRGLAELLVQGLRRYEPNIRLISPADPARRSSIIVFTLGDRAQDEEMAQQLEQQRIIVALRRRGIRVSPHFYNTAADIERMLDALDPIVQRSTL
ncbi:MAG: aminotransferase class V-fold PLP-dependent enzyme [Roseiflexaceae bacterium]|nr:aminotransferase class V-fold PLP-dependent enzyme [Roseiflexaceae bacterium]